MKIHCIIDKNKFFRPLPLCTILVCIFLNLKSDIKHHIHLYINNEKQYFQLVGNIKYSRKNKIIIEHDCALYKTSFFFSKQRLSILNRWLSLVCKCKWALPVGDNGEQSFKCGRSTCSHFIFLVWIVNEKKIWSDILTLSLTTELFYLVWIPF